MSARAVVFVVLSSAAVSGCYEPIVYTSPDAGDASAIPDASSSLDLGDAGVLADLVSVDAGSDAADLYMGPVRIARANDIYIIGVTEDDVVYFDRIAHAVSVVPLAGGTPTQIELLPGISTVDDRIQLLGNTVVVAAVDGDDATGRQSQHLVTWNRAGGRIDPGAGGPYAYRSRISVSADGNTMLFFANYNAATQSGDVVLTTRDRTRTVTLISQFAVPNPSVDDLLWLQLVGGTPGAALRAVINYVDTGLGRARIVSFCADVGCFGQVRADVSTSVGARFVGPAHALVGFIEAAGGQALLASLLTGGAVIATTDGSATLPLPIASNGGFISGGVLAGGDVVYTSVNDPATGQWSLHRAALRGSGAGATLDDKVLVATSGAPPLVQAFSPDDGLVLLNYSRIPDSHTAVLRGGLQVFSTTDPNWKPVTLNPTNNLYCALDWPLSPGFTSDGKYTVFAAIDAQTGSPTVTVQPVSGTVTTAIGAGVQWFAPSRTGVVWTPASTMGGLISAAFDTDWSTSRALATSCAYPTLTPSRNKVVYACPSTGAVDLITRDLP